MANPDEANIIREDAETDIGALITRAVRILMDRRWVVILTVLAVALVTIAVSLILPNRYTSEATIFAVQQRVPERYVVPTSTTDPSQALEAMVQEVLSRPRLLAVIDELNLHPKDRNRLRPEELLDLVRRDLHVDPIERMLGLGAVNAFKISFVAETPELAQAVTQKLTTLFIEQNLRARADQAATTTEFLGEQLELAKKELQSQEQRLRDFKMQFLGELPEQHQDNLGILANLQSQLDSVMASRSQAQQQRLYLESLESEYDRRAKRSGPMRTSTGEILTPLEAAESELVRLETERKDLLATYTPRHPDVVKKEKELALQRTLIDALRTKRTADPSTPREELPNSEEGVVIAQLRSQLRANKLEIENLTAKEEKLRTEIGKYEDRLNMTPVREQQLSSLQRDYDLMRQHYGELLKKEQESQLAADLEKRQEGQQFRLAEPPNLPTVPSSPKRLKISLMGLFGGLVLGCALAFALEFRSPTLRNEQDALPLELPLVVTVPALLTVGELRSRSRRRALEWVAGAAIIVVLVVAEFYVYRHG